MRFSNLHTHTTFSDGKDTPLKMAERAKELSFVSLGISDHSQTAFDSSYCMKPQDYPRYQKEIRSLKERMAGELEIYLGIEQDALSPKEPEGFDYVIGSVHYVVVGGEHFPVDHSYQSQMDFLEKCGKDDPMELAKRYFDGVVSYAQRNCYEIQGHFDLLTKYGLFDGVGEAYRRVALEALREVLRHVPYIEVNTGAVARGLRKEPYPQRFLLEEVLRLGGRVVLNGDSHQADTLDFHFEPSVQMLREIGFSSVWQLQKGSFTELSLALTQD